MPTNAGTAPIIWVTVPDMTTASTFTACSATNVITSTGTTGTCFGSTSTMTNAIYAVIDIDEEDWMNHAEYFQLAQQRGVRFRIRTAEERARAEAAAEQDRLDRERRRQVRHEAEARSRELLLAHLSAEQRETFERNKWFMVEGGKTGTRYRVKDVGVAGNVEVLQRAGVGDGVAWRLCCHCRDSEIPKYDHYLAQKIALQWDEERFLATANRRAA